jgi:hypothetical protein
VRLRDVTALRLDVRVGSAFAAYGRGRRGGWRRVGEPVLAPPNTGADRIALGPGVFGDLRVRPI